MESGPANGCSHVAQRGRKCFLYFGAHYGWGVPLFVPRGVALEGGRKTVWRSGKGGYSRLVPRHAKTLLVAFVGKDLVWEGGTTCTCFIASYPPTHMLHPYSSCTILGDGGTPGALDGANTSHG